MKIAISGINGFVGKNLSAYLKNVNHDIVPLTRNNFGNHDINELISDCDAVINLAGSPIIKRWNKWNKEKILNSRINTTSDIINAISIINNPPPLLINASAIGIYKPNTPHSESKYELGKGFLNELATLWEEQAYRAQLTGTRLIVMRLGVVLGEDGGIIKKLLPIFNRGLGGTLGNGNQFMSFIHINDLCKAINFFLTNKKSEGIYNLTSPQPTTNKEFTHILASLLNKKAKYKIPLFALKLMYGKSHTVITDSLNVKPERLLNSGFEFDYPDINSALKECIKKGR